MNNSTMKKAKKNYIVGAHLSIENGFAQALFDATNIGATALQIFTKSNRMWRSKPIGIKEIETWNDACKQLNFLKKNICIHASYLINLASEKNDVLEKSITSLIDECIRAQLLKIPTIILHPGARGNQSFKEACKKIIDGLSHVFSNTQNTVVAIESMAGQGTTVGSTLEELALIIHGLPKKFHSRIGICLDTCHLFAAGYKLDTKQEYTAFWRKFDTIIGRSFLKIIHVNDSKKELGLRVDRHEEIGKGLIPEKVFIELMQDSSLAQLPKILETPKNSLEDDARNLKRLLSYI